MTSDGKFPRVAVVGAGAVGSYFGGMLARAGVPVTLVGRAAHIEAIRRDGLLIDSIHFREHVPIEATTETAAVRDAEHVLLCVKTLDTESTARQIAPQLAPHAAVFSFQNGVDNVDVIRAASGIEAWPVVVYVAAAIPTPGAIKHSGGGRLVVGPGAPSAKLAAAFEQAKVSCPVSPNIEGELWKKLVFNCAGNAITALGRSSYGGLARHEPSVAVMRAAIEEVLAVACAAGVQVPDEDYFAAAMAFARNLGEATSSTAQDVQRGKRTEIDSLNGYVARRGADLGVPTPVNHTMYALLKLLEESTLR